MQIIAGFAKGMMLDVPSGVTVRPTTIRAKKALFDSLGPWTGYSVGDLFAGAGGLGLEALSRGAARVFFIEKDISHIRVLQKNCNKVQKAVPSAQLAVVKQDVLELKEFPFIPDILFADPPYAYSLDYLSSLIHLPLFNTLKTGTQLIWELPDHQPEAKNFNPPTSWEREKIRQYGSFWFLILRKI